MENSPSAKTIARGYWIWCYFDLERFKSATIHFWVMPKVPCGGLGPTRNWVPIHMPCLDRWEIIRDDAFIEMDGFSYPAIRISLICQVGLLDYSILGDPRMAEISHSRPWRWVADFNLSRLRLPPLVKGDGEFQELIPLPTWCRKNHVWAWLGPNIDLPASPQKRGFVDTCNASWGRPLSPTWLLSR